MLHVVAHAVSRDLLWRSHEEGLALWSRLLVLLPAALCLMPDHIHLLTDRYDHDAFVRLLSGYARWRHHRRGGQGRVWLPHPVPVLPGGPLHLQRTHRYIALNPCRDRLVADPLAWTWSTHRDGVGMTSSPVLVSALTRCPVDRLVQPGHPRQLLVAAARRLGGMPVMAVARRLGLSRSTVHREPPVRRELLDLVALVLDEPRFPALGSLRLDRTPAWRRYMDEQPARRRRQGWMFA